MLNGFKTYLGIIVALAPTVAHLFGGHVTPAFTSQFADTADSLIQLGGMCFAMYGRLVATAPGWFAKGV